MSKGDIATPKRTLEILDKYRLSAKKSLGQNFIIDTNILNNIVDSGSVDEQTVVIEIGPGIGALTEQIAKKAKHVYAFEIDSRLFPVLDDTLSDYENITIIEQDILKADLNDFQNQFLTENERLVVVANLPYYITTPIIMAFIESKLDIDMMIFMMQKEVARRISASPGTKEYGSLSIAIQYFMEAETLFTVPKTVFMPQPNVESAIIRLMKKEVREVEVKDESYLFQVTRSAFKQRRKTLWNNLKNAFGKEKEIQEKMKIALDQSDIDASRRGETLNIQEFANLADALYDQSLTFKC